MPLKRAIEVVLSPEAMEHLAGYTVYNRRIVLDVIEKSLHLIRPSQPGIESLFTPTLLLHGNYGLGIFEYTTR